MSAFQLQRPLAAIRLCSHSKTHGTQRCVQAKPRFPGREVEIERDIERQCVCVGARVFDKHTEELTPLVAAAAWTRCAALWRAIGAALSRTCARATAEAFAPRRNHSGPGCAQREGAVGLIVLFGCPVPLLLLARAATVVLFPVRFRLLSVLWFTPADMSSFGSVHVAVFFGPCCLGLVFFFHPAGA